MISAAIAFLALVWGVYANFSNRKVARVTYSVSQLSNFDVPKSILKGMEQAPFALTITNRGNKRAENIELKLMLNKTFENWEVSPPSTEVKLSAHKELTIESFALNPSQEIKLYMLCNGDGSESLIENFELSHSEGIGLVENNLQEYTISYFGIEFKFNPKTQKTGLVRLGPVRFT